MQVEESIVYLVDDDPAVRKTLPRGLLRRGFNVEAFDSAKAFLDSYSPSQPGCLILDLSMPDMDGLELQQELINRSISIPVIFITGHGGIPQSVQALKAGAIDFLEKPFFADALAKRIEEALRQDSKQRSNQQNLASIRSRFERLTDREQEVFQILLDTNGGLSSKEIARALSISHRTVEQHRSRILEKTQTRSVSGLLTLASQIDLLPSPTE